MATTVDQTPRLVATLDPDFAVVAIAFINAIRNEHQLPAVIMPLGARRSIEEQRELVGAGRSRTVQSAHVLGQAIDLDMLGWNRDRVPAWVWSELGPLGESFGLTWGGRWKSFPDVGHFEW